MRRTISPFSKYLQYSQRDQEYMDAVSTLEQAYEEAKTQYDAAYSEFKEARDAWMVAKKGVSAFSEQAKALREQYRVDELNDAMKLAKERKDAAYSELYDARKVQKEAYTETPVADSKTNYVDKRSIRRKAEALNDSYMKAVRSGNIKEAERIYNELAEHALANSVVRDKDGKLLVTYHHTANERFNKFDRNRARTGVEMDGFFFAPDAESTKEFGNTVIKAYLNITSPIYDHRFAYGRTQTSGRDERIRLANAGYDGLIRTENGEAYEYMTFNENQIFDASPVTYDDSGNVIPLSERFNADNDDIRYSERDTLPTAEDIIEEHGEELARNDAERDAVRMLKKRTQALDVIVTKMESIGAVEEAGKMEAAIQKKNNLDLLQKKAQEAVEAINKANANPAMKNLYNRVNEFIAQNVAGRTLGSMNKKMNAFEQLLSMDDATLKQQLKEPLEGLETAVQTIKPSSGESINVIRDRIKTFSTVMGGYVAKVTAQENYRAGADEISKVRRSIDRTVNRIKALRQNETDYKNVPEHLKPLADRLIAMVATHDEGANKLAFGTTQAQALAASYSALVAEHKEAFDADMNELLHQLQLHMDALNEIGSAQKVKNRTFRKQAERLAHLEAIDKAIGYVYGLIRSEQQAFLEGKRVAIETVAEPIINQVSKKKSHMSWHGAGSRAIDMADKGIRWGNMTPVYFFRNLGVDGLSQQNEALFNA
ncbi:MAG: hypothetical protein MJZ81_07940 [Bacteroidales bacterium]|nr:hypothetical protein [Bacteroidales bacterium]